MNFFNIGPMELLLILTVVLIVFGPDKIPDIAGSVGKMLRQFRQASKDITEELDLEDLSPSSIADALELKAAADEKAEAATAALPATAQSAETSQSEPTVGKDEPPDEHFHLLPEDQPESPTTEGTSGAAAPGEDDTSTQHFHLPPDVQSSTAGSAQDDASRQHFHLPAEPPAETAGAGESSPEPVTVAADHESSEDTD